MILLFIILGLIIELVWSPRLDYTGNNNLLLWYNIGINRRRYFKII